MNFPWLDDGAPLYVLLPVCCSQSWNGTLSDYETAVANSDQWIQHFRYQSVDGFIIGGDQSSILITSIDGDPLIIRWMYSESSESIIQYAMSLANTRIHSKDDIYFHNIHSDWEIFNPAYERSKLPEENTRVFKIETGMIRISTIYGEFESNSAITHRFSLL